MQERGGAGRAGLLLVVMFLYVSLTLPGFFLLQHDDEHGEGLGERHRGKRCRSESGGVQ